MKPLKKARQKNAPINKYYYSNSELLDMWNAGEIWTTERDENGEYLKPEPLKGYRNVIDYEFRLFLADIKDLKVALDDFGIYTTVAVSNSGKTYYINL